MLQFYITYVTQGIVYGALGEGTFLSHLIITFFLICTYLSHFLFGLSFDILVYLFKILSIILIKKNEQITTLIFWRFQRCNEGNITIETLLHDMAFMIEILITTNSERKCFQSNQINHLCQKIFTQMFIFKT